MKVTNNAPVPIVAFGRDARHGFGPDVTILPGETKDVHGPCVGNTGGRLIIGGSIVVEEGPGSRTDLQVSKGKQLFVNGNERGVTIRHFLDEPQSNVIAWRKKNTPPVVEQALKSA